MADNTQKDPKDWVSGDDPAVLDVDPAEFFWQPSRTRKKGG